MTITHRWLTGVSPDSPVSHVARRALSQKLPLVFYYLPLAVWHSDDDAEYVHQLRVSSRRAETALETFRFLLPKKKTKRVLRGLRHLRRAAGPAREFDVIQLRLTNGWTEKDATLLDESAREALCAVVQSERQSAQPALINAFEKQQGKQLEALTRNLPHMIREEGEKSKLPWVDVAFELLKPAVEKVVKRSEHVATSNELHALRIACKKLRYRMELTASAMDDAFRSEIYPLLRDIQQRLGQINDHVCAARQLKDMADASGNESLAGAIHPLVEYEQQAATLHSRQFIDWWTVARAGDFRRHLQSFFGAS